MAIIKLPNHPWKKRGGFGGSTLWDAIPNCFCVHRQTYHTIIIIYYPHSMHTKNTIMTKMDLRIHIAPVGFEIDRIVLPAKKRRADLVYLMVHDNPSEDKAGPFIEKIKKQLAKENIEVAIEKHDRLNLFKIIKSIKQIIEKEKGNKIYVNLASGSKIQAIAGMMACMMFNDEKNVIPFYVEAEEYLGFKGQQISSGIKEPMDIPSYEIKIPEQKHIQALNLIMKKGGKLTKKEMAELADTNKLITVNAEKENYSQARFTSLDKNIIEPLKEQWKFIDVEKIGRNHWIKITKEGINAAEFLI